MLVLFFRIVLLGVFLCCCGVEYFEFDVVVQCLVFQCCVVGYGCCGVEVLCDEVVFGDVMVDEVVLYGLGVCQGQVLVVFCVVDVIGVILDGDLGIGFILQYGYQGVEEGCVFWCEFVVFGFEGDGFVFEYGIEYGLEIRLQCDFLSSEVFVGICQMCGLGIEVLVQCVLVQVQCYQCE